MPYGWFYEFQNNEQPINYTKTCNEWQTPPYTFTTLSTTNYLRLTFCLNTATSGSSAIPVTPDDLRYCNVIEYGKGTQIPISWQSEAGTVYGGTLDVTSGVLTVTHGIKDDATAIRTGTGASGAIYADITVTGITLNTSTICSHYKQILTSNVGAIGKFKVFNNEITVYDDRFTSVSEADAILADVQFVYELATPQTYQLTPEEVTTLLAQNNIWADCGPSTVEYPCDTKLYIERLTAPEEDDMIADAQIASGQYFIVNNNLYLSTAAILAGDPIKPGTNCTLTNLAAALNAINS